MAGWSVVADGGEAALGPNAFCGRDRGGVSHFSVQAVCWAGLEAFAAVSCLQSVVGKTGFVAGNVNQHNLLPMNKLLITNSGIEKKYIQGCRENTSSSPVLVSNPPAAATLSPFSKTRGGLGDWGQSVVIPFLLLLFVPWWISLVWLLPLAAVACI